MGIRLTQENGELLLQENSAAILTEGNSYITIDDIDRSSIINWKSITREEVLTKEPNSFTFLIKKHGGQTYKPDVGDEIVFTADGIKEFGGYVVEINEAIEGRLEYIKVICKDYTHILDRLLVAKTYTGETVDDIIDDLVTTFSLGITFNNVSCPVTIETVQFNYLPISKCLEKLTTFAEGYEWYIDYNKDIHFFASGDVPSSFDVTDTSENYVFNSLEIREDTHQLRNEIIIRGGLLTSETTRVELLVGDGTKKIFPLATKFAERPAVSINGSAITVGIENLEPEGYHVMWDYNQKSLRFATALTTGTTSVTALYQYPLIYQQRDNASVAAYGVFQQVIVDKTIRDLDTAALRADVEILKYGSPLRSGNFVTYRYGLKVGQTINISSDIRGLNEDFTIQAIRTKLRTPHTAELIYEVEAITADDLGINDVLSRLLVKNPSDLIEFTPGEAIDRIRTEEESIGIVDTVGTPTITSGPYLLGTTTVMGFFTMG